MAYQGTSPNLGTYKKLDAITFDGTSTTYAVTSNGLQVSLVTAESCMVSLNGVIQNPGVSYTVAGSNITFAVAPSAGSSFFGILLGERVLVADALPLSGGTMTGNLTLAADPTGVLQAAPKQYVDGLVSSALSSAATLTGTETLTNKTLVAPVLRDDIVFISTASNAVASKTHVFIATATLTLPGSPVAGDQLRVVNMSGTATCVLGRNGSNIMGLAQDMTIDVNNFGGSFVYADATRGWVLV
jgi:hypothetical protein